MATREVISLKAASIGADSEYSFFSIILHSQPFDFIIFMSETAITGIFLQEVYPPVLRQLAPGL